MLCPCYFNSRPSARGDLYYPPFGVMQLISIHAPPRGATHVLKNRECSTRRFQFTPLREGRLHRATPSCVLPISIHAPPRGATPVHSANFPSAQISIHAPPRGATEITVYRHKSNRFQFTPLREGRPEDGSGVRLFQISIHAPPRGATA